MVRTLSVIESVISYLRPCGPCGIREGTAVSLINGGGVEESVITEDYLTSYQSDSPKGTLLGYGYKRYMEGERTLIMGEKLAGQEQDEACNLRTIRY